jgi:hypothetical protein
MHNTGSIQYPCAAQGNATAWIRSGGSDRFGQNGALFIFQEIVTDEEG